MLADTMPESAAEKVVTHEITIARKKPVDVNNLG